MPQKPQISDDKIGIYKDFILDFPEEFRENQDFQTLAGIMNSLDQEMLDSIWDMKTFWDNELASAAFLNYIGYGFGAQIDVGDSDRTKRIKLRDAVKWHRQKGREDMAKYWIELVTGVEPNFLSAEDDFGFFMVWESQDNLLPFPNDFMRWESDNAYVEGGMAWLSGSADPSAPAFRYQIYVDTKVDNLNKVTLDRVEEVIKYFGAVYMEYYIGYRDVQGNWNLYRTVYAPPA